MRHFIKCVSALYATAHLSSSLYAQQEQFPAPPTHWSLNSPHIVPVVGLRPFREGGIRTEIESRDGIWVVHNYGHGGAGLTLSWGSAYHSVALAKQKLTDGQTISIIGGGVIGLSTAHVLASMGYQVRVFSDKFFPNNVSNVAGGLWSPVSVDLNAEDNASALLQRSVQVSSYMAFDVLMNSGWPIKRIPLFVTEEAREKSGLDLFLQLPNLFKIIFHPKLPIVGVSQPGYEVETFLIDTPRYMRHLITEVEKMGVEFIQTKFSSFEEVAGTVGAGAVVFNCTGLGAQKLAADPRVIPVRGDLVYIKASEHFTPSDYAYMAFYGASGTDYAFFREGEVVVGGTFIKGESSTTVNPETCEQKLASFKSFFGSR